MSSQSHSGGNLSAPNRAPAAKVIAGALANNRVAQALISALGSYSLQSPIVAAHASPSTDFGSLQSGDYIVDLSASPPSHGVVSSPGVSPITPSVGDLMLVLRPVNLDSNNPLVPAGGALEANKTGDSGEDF